MPLPLRGCISFGRHLCDGNFVVGPAVDQAAEYMNEPDGAFIWVLPGVAERHNTFLQRALALMDQPKETIMAAHTIAAERGADVASKVLNHPEAGSDPFIEAMRMTYAQLLAIPIVIEAYPMPTKRGSVIDAAIINPLISAKNDEEAKRIIDRYDQFLQGDRMDIWTKRQNTLKFLAIAQAAVVQFRSNLGTGG